MDGEGAQPARGGAPPQRRDAGLRNNENREVFAAHRGACRRDRQRIIVKAAITMAAVVAGLVKTTFADITAVAVRPSLGQRWTSGHKHEGDLLGDNQFFRGIARSAERE
jgi:hypothetical protein